MTDVNAAAAATATATEGDVVEDTRKQLDSVALFGDDPDLKNGGVKELDSKALFADSQEVVDSSTPVTAGVHVAAIAEGTTEVVEETEPEEQKNVLKSISARTQAGKQYFLKDVELTTTVLQLKELIVKQEGSLSVAAVKLIHKGKPLAVRISLSSFFFSD